MRKYLWACSIGFLLGVPIAWASSFGPVLGIFALLLGVGVLVLTRERYAIIMFCVLAGVSFGVFRYTSIPASTTILDSVSNSFMGDVIEEPKIGDSNTGFFIHLLATDTRPSIKIYASTIVAPDIQYGDRVELRGKLIDVQREKAPDYWKTYLQTHGIAYEIKNTEIVKIESGHGNPILYTLFRFKKFIVSKITGSMPEPEAGLLSGILLGARTTLGKDLTDQFQKIGVSHIIALSGFNITIIANAIHYIFEQSKFLPATLGIYTSGTVVILFVLMTGASTSAVRAAVMALILLLARKEGRTYDAGTALVVAAVIMVLWNPLILMNDFGFQLSFLASIGIIYLMPVLALHTKKIPDMHGLKELLLGTISAEVMVMPFIIYKTGVVSLISLIANAVILPVIPILMTLGFVLIIVALFGYYIALPIAWLNYALLAYIISAVRILYHAPFAFITVSYVSLPLILLWYASLIYVMINHHDQKSLH